MKVNLYSPLNCTSYGYASTYLFRELIRNKIDIKYFPISQIQPETRFLDELKPYLNQECLVNDGPCLKIWHQHDLSHFIGKGARIGFTIFELDKFTEREKNHLESCDALIVCSHWAKSVVHANTSCKNVHVVPLGYDPEIFFAAPSKKQKTGPFVFANFGKWEIRKGHDVLKEAFNKAFTKEDNVELWMLPHNFHISEYQQKTWENFYKSSPLGDKIKIGPRLTVQAEVASVMRGMDCAIFPARAEGWNLEALEALACGKTVISTNYSGPTEFLTKKNSLLIECPEREVAYDGVFFNGQGSWAKFTRNMLDEMVELMRKVYKDGPTYNEVGVNSVKHLTWENSGKKLIEVLDEYD